MFRSLMFKVIIERVNLYLSHFLLFFTYAPVSHVYFFFYFLSLVFLIENFIQYYFLSFLTASVLFLFKWFSVVSESLQYFFYQLSSPVSNSMTGLNEWCKYLIVKPDLLLKTRWTWKNLLNKQVKMCLQNQWEISKGNRNQFERTREIEGNLYV